MVGCGCGLCCCKDPWDGAGKGQGEAGLLLVSPVPGAVVASASHYVESLEPAAVPWRGAWLLELQPCPARGLVEKLLIAVRMACVV